MLNYDVKNWSTIGEQQSEEVYFYTQVKTCFVGETCHLDGDDDVDFVHFSCRRHIFLAELRRFWRNLTLVTM